MFIVNSNIPKQGKSIANIFKLTAYQFLYLHWLSCMTNYVILMNAPKEYVLGPENFYYDKDGAIA